MAFDAYIAFVDPKVDAESTSDRFASKDKGMQIQISSYKFGTTMPPTASRSDTGAATAGRGKFMEFEVEKNVDLASAILAKQTAYGTVFKEIIIRLFFTTGSGGKERQSVQVVYIKLKQAVISKCDISAGGGDDLPNESLAINYGEIEFAYRGLKIDGSADSGKKSEFGWSAITNKKIVPAADGF